MENRSNDYCVEVKNVSIEFPGVKALQDVSCTFRGGHIAALVGANGAGKSTLMKVLSGVNPTYTGAVFINGEEIRLSSPQIARSKGIEIVYQEVDTVLAPNLTIGENIMMDYIVYDMHRKSILNWNYINDTASSALKSLDMYIDPKKLVSSLTLAQKQMVVIARALQSKCNILILDEPTAPLSHAETQKLFEIVRKLKSNGVGVIFISHRLNELFEICETITVLRDGKLVDSFDLDNSVTVDSIVEAMLGKTCNEVCAERKRKIGEILLETVDLCDENNKIRNINLTLHSGEIVGLFGLVGAGKTELCKTLFGATPRNGGEIKIRGKKVKNKTPYQAVAAGMAFIPEERRKEGVIISESVCHNLSISTISDFSGKSSIIKVGKEVENAKTMVSGLGIKTPSIFQKVALLSGGNQQKVTLGKWLASKADIYIFDEPTKGIDVGAKNEIYKLIMELADQGKAIVYASSEQNEILRLSDRIYVMYDGTIQCEFENKEITEEQLIFYSTGGNNIEK